MSENKKSFKPLVPALSLVFGSGAGMLTAILCSFYLAVGLIAGAAAGLLVGLVLSQLLFKQSK